MLRLLLAILLVGRKECLDEQAYCMVTGIDRLISLGWRGQIIFFCWYCFEKKRKTQKTHHLILTRWTLWWRSTLDQNEIVRDCFKKCLWLISQFTTKDLPEVGRKQQASRSTRQCVWPVSTTLYYTETKTWRSHRSEMVWRLLGEAELRLPKFLPSTEVLSCHRLCLAALCFGDCTNLSQWLGKSARERGRRCPILALFLVTSAGRKSMNTCLW